jgi:ATP-dependent DNA ligase
MTPAVAPELQTLPAGLVLDGEIVAWREREPYFPDLCRRVLNRDGSVPITFVAFDLLRLDGTDMTKRPYSERRSLLESLGLHGPGWTTGEVLDDVPALFDAVCALGLEGEVAKKRSSHYRPGERGWVKIKNADYWRRDAEREAVVRSRERRARARARPCRGAASLRRSAPARSSSRRTRTSGGRTRPRVRA